MHIEPVTALIGAEITGADLENLSDAGFAQIEQAFTEHQVLFFRDQPPLSPEADVVVEDRPAHRVNAPDPRSATTSRYIPKSGWPAVPVVGTDSCSTSATW